MFFLPSDTHFTNFAVYSDVVCNVSLVAVFGGSAFGVGLLMVLR